MNYLEPTEVKLIPREAEVLNDISNDATRDISRMPGKGDNAFRAEWIRVVSVAAATPHMHAANLAQSAFQFAAVKRGIAAHRLSCEHKLIAKRRGNWAPGLEQGLKMRFSSLLKAQHSLTPVAAMRVASRQKRALGNPHAILISSRLDFRDRNYHSCTTVAVGQKTVNNPRILSKE